MGIENQKPQNPQVDGRPPTVGVAPEILRESKGLPPAIGGAVVDESVTVGPVPVGDGDVVNSVGSTTPGGQRLDAIEAEQAAKAAATNHGPLFGPKTDYELTERGGEVAPQEETPSTTDELVLPQPTTPAGRNTPRRPSDISLLAGQREKGVIGQRRYAAGERAGTGLSAEDVATMNAAKQASREHLGRRR